MTAGLPLNGLFALCRPGSPKTASPLAAEYRRLGVNLPPWAQPDGPVRR